MHPIIIRIHHIIHHVHMIDEVTRHDYLINKQDIIRLLRFIRNDLPHMIL